MSDEEKREEEIIKRKLNFFYNSELPIHIVFHNATWENGFINEMGSDFIMLRLFPEGEKKSGMKIIPIFFLEIKDVDEYWGEEK